MNFIVNYRNFIPIKTGLERCGYTVYENLWRPTQAQLDDCHGYLICLYDAIKRPDRILRLKRMLKAAGVPLIGWNRDGPWNKGEKPWRLALLKSLKILDIYASHTLQAADGFAPVVLFLPNAAWTDVYNLAGAALEAMRDPHWYAYDVSFIGNFKAEKYPEFHPRADFLSQVYRRLSSLNLKFCFKNGAGVSPAEQVAVIQKSRINLNFGAACDDGLEKSFGLPERCFGVPACGGFLLSEERGHAKDSFILGEEWVSFSDIDDCVAKIKYYLAHLDEARKIAERAYRRIMREHTYDYRAKTLIQAASDWRNRAINPGIDAGRRFLKVKQ